METLIAPADAELVTRRLREARTADAPQEVRWRTAGGADRVVLLRLIAVAAPEEGAWTLSIGHDVTEERDAQRALSVSEGRLRTILDNTTAHVSVVDASCRFLLVNRAFGETFKADPASVVGRSLHDFFAADVARQLEENNRAILRTGTAIEFEEVVPQDDGLHTYISVKAPLVDAGGEVYAICGISTDITERKRLEQDLRQADRRKDEFIATVAHELRQPLAPIVTALELVKRGASAETARRAFEVIQRQVGQMERLIEDLLDAARIVQGKVGIRPERIALNDVITSALSVVRPLVREREQELHVQLPGDPVPITADPQHLQQVFSNLLDNAAKFTPRGGRIGLTVEPGLETVVVRVTDTGRGIPAEMLPGIFDLFAQGSADERGIGVGLAVVRGLVERHGGSVMAYSEGPDKGAEFVVRLPREKEIAQEAAS